MTSPTAASKRVLIALLSLGVLHAGSSAPAADEPPEYEEATQGDDAGQYEGAVPPRLSLAEGDVSFFRSGAEDWAKARANTPLAAGDQLWVGSDSNLEIEIGPRAFVRAGPGTQLALDSHERDFDQLRVSGGDLSLDARSLPPGRVIEIDTPQGAYSIERAGYYRVTVDDDSTTFTARRGGRATVTVANGRTERIEPSEQVLASGDEPELESYAAPDLDAWDRWNYERSDYQVDARSHRYVSDEVYGVGDLDHHGTWRVVPTYGAVWVPSRVPVGWAPYSRGHWISDPFYGWSWVDDAPWGWAPYHYGRWVFTAGFWAWAPGPIVVRPFYAPALVAFFGVGPFTFSIGLGGPTTLGWVPLGWGEPCIPWWGRRGFIGHPRWFGWGGPRIVIDQHISVTNVNVYSNARHPHAFVAVPANAFGRRPVETVRIAGARPDRMRVVEGSLPVSGDPGRISSSFGRGGRPPAKLEERRVYATRTPERPDSQRHTRVVEPRRGGAPEPVRDRAMRTPPATQPERGVEPERGRRVEQGAERRTERAPQARSETGPVEKGSERRLESAPQRNRIERPPFGTRGGVEREPAPPAPRYEETRRRTQTERAPRTTPRATTRKVERPAQALPGTPADRVYQRGGERVTPQSRVRAAESGARSRTAAPQPGRTTREPMPAATGSRGPSSSQTQHGQGRGRGAR